MMKTTFTKSITVALIFAQIFWFAAYFPVQNKAKAQEDDQNINDIADDGNGIPADESQLEDDNAPVNYTGPVISDPAMIQLPASTSGTATGAAQVLSNKIILNASDKADLNKMVVVHSALPDLSLDISELARLSGRNETDLQNLKSSSYDEFSKIITDTQTKFFTDDYIKQRLMNNPDILAQVLNVDPTSIVQQMQDASGKQYLESAINDVLSIKFDRHTIETLNYLVRSKDDPRGGAGHSQITVYRLRRTYDRDPGYSNESKAAEETEKQKAEQEKTTIEKLKATQDAKGVNTLLTDTGLTEQNTIATGQITDNSSAGKSVSDFLLLPDTETFTNISAHHSGQAFDISQIDQIKCTLIKKHRIGGDTKTAQPPVNIKLLWQTQDGYNKDKDTIDASYNQMFMRMGQQSITDLLGSLNVDFENMQNMKGANFNDIMAVVGQAFFANAMSSPTGDMWKFDIGSTLRNIGGVMVADNLVLPRQPFLDSNITTIDALSEAIGRYQIEKSLNLPYGSLAGKNNNEIYAQIGKSRTEQELNLPPGALSQTFSSPEDFYQKIGSTLIETEYGLPKGSFLGKSSMKDVEAAAGIYKVRAAFAFPQSMDLDFGLTQDESTKARAGSMSISDYVRTVAKTYIARMTEAFSSNQDSMMSLYTSLPGSTGTPTGNDIIQSIRDGNISGVDFKTIGINSIATTLESGDAARSRLSAWLTTPNQSYSVNDTIPDPTIPGKTISQTVILPYQDYASRLTVLNTDVYALFSGTPDAASGIYKRLGKKALTDALMNSDVVERAKQDLLAKNTQLGETVQKYEFYKTRLDTISSQSSNFTKQKKALVDSINQLDSSILDQPTKSSLTANLIRLESEIGFAGGVGDNPDAILTYARQVTSDSAQNASFITTLNGLATRANTSVPDFSMTVSAMQYEAEIIAKSAYEILTGKEQPSFRFEDMNLSDIQSSIDLGNLSVGTGDVAMLLSGHMTLEDFLLSVGSAKIGSALNIPPKALKYAAAAIKALQDKNVSPKDAFFRAIGMASMEDQANSASSFMSPSDLGTSSSISNVRDRMVSSMNVSTSQANNILAESLGLKGFDLEQLMRNSFALWNTARPLALNNDVKNNLPAGTTEKFIIGKSIGRYTEDTLNDNEIRLVSSKLHISEAAIKTFIAARDGQENPSINKIYFVDQNRYLPAKDSDATCAPATSIDDTTHVDVIADNSFYYYDKNGLHTFNSYAAANEFRQAHPGDELKYLEEFTNSISFGAYHLTAKSPVAVPASTSTFFNNFGKPLNASDYANNFTSAFGGIDSVQSALNTYVSSSDKQYAFGYDGYSNLINFLYYGYGIPLETANKLFSRTAFVDSGSPVDYLKISGFNLVKNFAAAYLNNSLGINIGSDRITADDIYSILDGNSKEVFGRIGGSFLDDELGLTRGSTEGILSASTTGQRQCEMDRAAMQFIGSQLGISGLALDGSLFNNFGGSVIENFLGLPRGSFGGANIQELLNKVPASNFVKAFNIPMTQAAVAAADLALKAIGEDFYQAHKGQTVPEKVALVNAYTQALEKGTISDPLYFASMALNNIFKANLAGILKPGDLYSTDFGKAVNGLKAISGFSPYYTDDQIKEMVVQFHSRLSSIDSALGLTPGRTGELLQGINGVTPDTYRNNTRDGVLINLAAQKVIDALGLADRGLTLDRIKQFIAAVKEIGDKTQTSALNRNASQICSGSIFSSSCRDNPSVVIFKFLNDSFSLNLDKKAGFTNGTIARIITRPDEALPILIDQGAKKLDQQLGIECDDDNAQCNKNNFEKYVGIYFGDIDADKAECARFPEEERASCLNGRRLNRVSAAAQTSVMDNARNGIVDELAKLVGVDIGGLYSVSRGTLNANILGMFKGDYRPLLAILTMRGIGAAIGTDGDPSRPSVPDSFFFSYQRDIISAFFGNKETDDAVAARARASFIACYNSNSCVPGSEDAVNSPDTPFLDFGGSVNAHFNTNNADSADSAVLIQTNLRYPVPDGASTDLPPLTVEEPLPPDRSLFTNDADYQTASSAFLDQEMKWQEADGGRVALEIKINNAAATAVSEARNGYKEYIEYRTADIMLRKVDANIPTGFAWAMYKGNGYVKSVALANYLENVLRDEGIFSEGVPDGTVGFINSYLFSSDPLVKGKIDVLIKNLGATGFATIDTFLSAHSPTLLGMSLGQPGTAAALFQFIKTGDFSSTISTTINGELKNVSLKSLYSTDWIAGKVSGFADTKFGLPPGTTYQVYTNFRTYQTAKTALSFYGSKGILDSAQFNKAYDAFKTANPTSTDTASDFLKNQQNQARTQMTEVTAAVVTMIINMVFEKQIAAAESALGLVPGTGGMAVGMLISLAFGLPVSPIAIGMFIVMNLFGVYKVEMLCTADGYYPRIDPTPDSSKFDNGGLGEWNGMDPKVREKKYIESAQYKANKLVQDLYEMPARTGDDALVPTQIMTGRWEDVNMWAPLTESTICKKVGSGTQTNGLCDGSKAGMWANPQTTAYTHVGF